MGRGATIFCISCLVTIFLVVSLAFLSSIFGWQPPTDYDEEIFQDYADEQYALHFSDSEAYEDNLLIVVLTKKNRKDFYYIAWVGDQIHPNVNVLLGNNDTALGRAMNNNINPNNYSPSLDSDLAKVVEDMTTFVSSVETDTKSLLTCTETKSRLGKFVNNTKLSMDASLVEPSLQKFADYTGIPVTLIVEDAADVFPQYKPYLTWAIIAGIGIVSVTTVAVVYTACKKQKSTRRN